MVMPDQISSHDLCLYDLDQPDRTRPSIQSRRDPTLRLPRSQRQTPLESNQQDPTLIVLSDEHTLPSARHALSLEHVASITFAPKLNVHKLNLSL